MQRLLLAIGCASVLLVVMLVAAPRPHSAEAPPPVVLATPPPSPHRLAAAAIPRLPAPVAPEPVAPEPVAPTPAEEPPQRVRIQRQTSGWGTAAAPTPRLVRTAVVPGQLGAAASRLRELNSDLEMARLRAQGARLSARSSRDQAAELRRRIVGLNGAIAQLRLDQQALSASVTQARQARVQAIQEKKTAADSGYAAAAQPLEAQAATLEQTLLVARAREKGTDPRDHAARQQAASMVANLEHQLTALHRQEATLRQSRRLLEKQAASGVPPVDDGSQRAAYAADDAKITDLQSQVAALQQAATRADSDAGIADATARTADADTGVAEALVKAQMLRVQALAADTGN